MQFDAVRLVVDGSGDDPYKYYEDGQSSDGRIVRWIVLQMIDQRYFEWPVTANG
jgi:hypothetical protein